MVWSTEEAAMGVLLDDQEEIVDSIDFGAGLIAVPLQICTLPQDPPIAFVLVERRLCDAMFNGLASSRPMRTYLKYLDTFRLHPKCEINVLAEVYRRSTPFNEVGN